MADVANQIKFAPRQIEALEADDFRQLQGMTFLRGFVRSYAKILQLDVQPLLEQLPVEKPVQPQLTPASVDTPFPSMLSSRQQNLIWSGAALLVGVLVVIFGIMHFSSPGSLPEIAQTRPNAAPMETPVSLPTEIQAMSEQPMPEVSVAASVPAPVKEKPVQKTKTAPASGQSAPAVVAQTSNSVAAGESQSQEPVDLLIAQPEKPAKKKRVTVEIDHSLPVSSLRLVFGDESWTEIKDKSGKTISSQINQPGSELRLQGNPPFTMLIGRALSVQLYQDDEVVDLKPYINKYSEVAHVVLE